VKSIQAYIHGGDSANIEKIMVRRVVVVILNISIHPTYSEFSLESNMVDVLWCPHVHEPQVEIANMHM
jgi:hypothetical protein